MRVHIEIGHTDSESAQRFWFRKTQVSFSCAPDDGVRNLRLLNLESDALPMEPPRHPWISNVQCFIIHLFSRSVSPTLHCIGCELNLKPQPPIQTVRFVLAATLRHVCITPAVKNRPCCTEEMASFSKPYLLLLFFWVDTDCSFAAEQLRIQRKNFGITLLKFRLEGLNKSVVYYYYYVIIVIVMRLRTGHSQPNAHVCRKFKLASSPTCDCSLEDQTSERLLQRYAPFVKE